MAPNSWAQIQLKLDMCSSELVKWYAKKKKLPYEELNEKMLRLELLQAQNIPNVSAIRNLVEEISLWLEKEDLRWRQRAKKDWYKLGDQNTKFFHACASQ